MKRFIGPQSFSKLSPLILTGASQSGPNAASFPTCSCCPFRTSPSPSTPALLTVYAFIVPSALNTLLFPFPLENTFSSFSVWLCRHLLRKALCLPQAGSGTPFSAPRDAVFILQNMASHTGLSGPPQTTHSRRTAFLS